MHRRLYGTVMKALPLLVAVSVLSSSGLFGLVRSCFWGASPGGCSNSVQKIARDCHPLLVAALSRTTNAPCGADMEIDIGSTNPNGQILVEKTTGQGNNHFASKWVLICSHCDYIYGANSCDFISGDIKNAKAASPDYH